MLINSNKEKSTYVIISELKTMELLLILNIGILPRAAILILLAFLKLNSFFAIHPAKFSVLVLSPRVLQMQEEWSVLAEIHLVASPGECND